MSNILYWLPLVLFSALTGIYLLKYLTVHPLEMDLYLVLAFLTLFGWALVIWRSYSGVVLLAGVLLSLASLIASYLIMTRIFLNREDPRPLPKITRQEGDPGAGHTAVIYFTHGEPETYDPIGWINQFREFDQQKIAFVPIFARPFFVFQLRNHYLRVGMSQHRQIHLRMLKCLEQEFRKSGDMTTRFYISFLDDAPRPDAAVIQALNDGASHIIVSEVFLTISNHTAEGEKLIHQVDVGKYAATLEFSQPLWDSKTLMSMFVRRANECIGAVDKSKIGILLVGHGQPVEWDREWPTETSHEISFRQNVLKLLEQDGFLSQNMNLAWMEFREPHAAEMVEKFYQNGVEKILFFAAAISADSIHSQYDIPANVRKARVPAEYPTINLGAWNDDPIVIQAIKENVDLLMRSNSFEKTAFIQPERIASAYSASSSVDVS